MEFEEYQLFRRASCVVFDIIFCFRMFIHIFQSIILGLEQKSDLLQQHGEP